MTLVIAWYKHGGATINVAADSRIGGRADSPPLTDHGPKILPIRVIARSGHGDEERETTAVYGYGFAGSTLGALTVHSIASGCLETLWSSSLRPPPSVAAVAGLYEHVAKQVVNGPDLAFESFILGHCVRDVGPRIFRLDAKGLASSITELPVIEETYHAIGSGADRVPRLLEEARALNDKSGIMQVIRLAVDYDGEPDVGGHTQVGRSEARTGFRLYPILRFRTSGPFRVFQEMVGVCTEGIEVDGLEIGGARWSINDVPITGGL